MPNRISPDDVLIAMEREIRGIEAYASGFYALEVEPFVVQLPEGELAPDDHLGHANESRARHGRETHIAILMEATKIAHRMLGIRPTTPRGLAVKARLLLDGRLPVSWKGDTTELPFGERLTLSLIHDVIRIAETQRPAPPPKA